MYVDETGDLGMAGKTGESQHFGIGSAVFQGHHGDVLWAGKNLRFDLERRGVPMPRGFHAKDDTPRTRHEVYSVISDLEPRFDFTMLDKTRAYGRVRERGEVYLYKLAWYLHFKEVLKWVSKPGDHVFVAAGTLGTAKRVVQAESALRDVCSQVATSRSVHLAIWEARTSFGIQVADYGLWSVQRRYERNDELWYSKYVEKATVSCFRPWN